MRTVYLDHAATTPIDHRVMELMHPYFTEHYGNANSPHQMGRKAHVAVEESREKIAQLINCRPEEVVFTSGGTESDNAIIKGVLEATEKRKVITAGTEHHAVLHPLEYLEKKGVEVEYLELNNQGLVDPEAVEKAIDEDTALVSLMHLNNETGIIQPINEIGAVCREYGVLYHSDTVQSMGKIPLDFKDTPVDFIAASSHKFYGPKGVGFMVVRNDVPWRSWMHGGSQEHNRRGGTLNVPGIIGMARALELAFENLENYTNHFEQLRSQLLEGLEQKFGNRVRINGDRDNGARHILNISLTDTQGQPMDGEMLLMNLDMEGVCLASGSACTAGAVDPSHVLQAMGLSKEQAQSSLRISLGKDNTPEDIAYFLGKLEVVVERLSK